MSKAAMTALPYTGDFKPTSVPGCQLWLDGNDPAGTGTPPANGAGIATWVNKGLASTNLVLYTTNGGSNPTYSANFQNGKGSVAFNNNAFLSSFPFNLSTRTIFLVCKQNVAQFSGIMGLSAANNDSVSSTTGIAFQASEGAWHFSWLYNIFNPSNQILYANSSPNTGYYLYTGTSAIATPLNIYEEVFSSNYEQTFVNGTAGQTFTTTTTPGSSTQIYVGARWNATGSGQSLNGNILEVIIYSTALTQTQRQSVEGYLAWKWGIQASLPQFVPTSVGGTQLWLDGADITTQTFSGANITAWNDKSGNNYHMNQPALAGIITQTAAYPTAGTAINGKSTVNFSPQAGLKQSNNLNGVRNLYWVGRISNSGGSGYYFLFGQNTYYDWHANEYSPSNRMLWDIYTSAELRNSTASLYTLDANAAVNTTFGNIYYPSNSSISILSVSGITGSSTLYQGICYDRSYHVGWCGDLAEVLVYSTALTNTQHQQVEGYLAWKWGMQAQLPITHPYYGAAPTVHPYGAVAPTGPNALGITRAPAVTALVPTVKRAMTSLSYNAAFLPTSITGCAMWLDAADSSSFTFSSGTTISLWKDKSGSANNFTVTTGTTTRITDGGVNVVNFPSGGSTMTSSSSITLTTNHSVFIVTKLISNTFGLGYLLSCPALKPSDNAQGVSGDYSIRYNPSFITPSTGNGGDIFYNNTGGYYANGTLSGVPTATSYHMLNGRFSQGGTTQIALSFGGVYGRYFVGTVAEVIIFSQVLTTAQRQQIEGYLAWKWGLQAKLPLFTGSLLSSPTVLSGCQLWLDGADSSSSSMTFSGSNITAWLDKSGTGNNMTVTGTGYPYLTTTALGSQCIAFNGSNNFYNATTVMSGSNNTYFFVATATTNTTGGLMYWGANGRVLTDWFYYNNPVGYFSFSSNQFFTPSNALVAITENVGVLCTGYINGTSNGSQSSVAMGSNQSLMIGSQNANYWRGTIQEVIIYNSAFTTTQRQQVEGYLAWKWGIQGNLPSNHPYYSATPNHPYVSAAPTGPSQRPAAVTALVPTPTPALTAIVKPIYSLTLANAGSNDAFVVKYKSTGSLLWAARIASTGDDRGVRVRTDTAGNLYALGYTGGTATLYNTDGSTYGTIAASTYLIKYSAAGIIQWVSRISGGTPYDIAVDSVNNVIYVCGKGSSLTFYNAAGTSVINYTLTFASVPGYIAKYDSSGTPLWASYMGATTGSAGYSTQNNGICISPDGTSVYVTGTWSGSALAFYNSDQSTGLLTAWGGGLFLAKYNSSGFYQWGCQVVGYRDNYGIKITCDSSYIYLLVYYRAGFLRMYDVDGTFRIILDSQSNGKNNIGVVSYNTSGYAQWSASTRGSGSGNEFSYDITVDSSSNIYIIGTYNTQSVNVYNSKSTGSETLYNTYTNAGSDDTIIVKYNSSGTPQWVVTIGGTLADIGYAISYTASGNIIVAGTTTSASLTFTNSDGSSGRTLTNSSGVQNMWLASYTAAGFINWASMMTVTAASQIAGAALSTDGSAYITGYMGTGGATFGFGR